MGPDSAFYVVVASAAAAVLLAWVYFRAYQVSRAPIGVINLRDVALMIGAIVLVPYLYLIMPPWLATTLLGLGTLTILQVTFEPILPGAWMAWIIALGLLGPGCGGCPHLGRAEHAVPAHQQHRPCN